VSLSVLRLSPFLSFCVSGVDQFPDDEHPLSSMRRSNVVSTHNNREDFVALAFQFFNDPLKAMRFEANDSKRVLCHDPSRSALADDAEKLAP
jgi:hypothetical protein